MCGISGMFGASRPEAVKAMVAAMHHRGPDDTGVYADERAAIGMARLSILDLSNAGHQPMGSPDGLVWIVYNGETYNFPALRQSLEALGEVFHSHTDTEVVLKLYLRHGDSFVEKLRGMFAVAIYDKRRGPGRERLLLARDHLGIKPLLYAKVHGVLLFASEMKAMLASGMIEREPDPVAFRQLLTYGSILQPRTALQGVQMLLPGHRLVVEGEKTQVERYWSLGTNRIPNLAQQPYEEQVDAVSEALAESVRLQMLSDVPLGAFLSGGVDSSLIAALMTRATGKPVKTFSVGYAGEFSAMDETVDAERLAKFIGTEHKRVQIDGAHVAANLHRLAAAIDQPTVDGANSYFVSQAARPHVTVALTGTGGDELFAGYPWFIHMVAASRKDHMAPLRSAAKALIAKATRAAMFDRLITGKGGSRLEQLRLKGDFLGRFARQYQIFSARDAAKLLSPAMAPHAQAGHAQALDILTHDELPHTAPLQRVSALTIRGYLKNQLLRDIDAVSMAHSLEVRVPLVDPVIADVALSLADSAKLDPQVAARGGLSYTESGAKKVLIDLGVKHGLLPKDIGAQPKRGFGMPFAHWMQHDLRDALEDALSPSTVRRRGVFAPDQAMTIKADFLAGRTSWAKPWLLMMTELWFRAVIDAPLPKSGVQA